MDFIFTNFELVIGIVVLLAVLIFGGITRQWSLVRISAYQLMLSAEKLFATEEGKEKFEMVLSKLWELLPGWLKKAVGLERLRQKLQDWYNLAKDMLHEDVNK
jgi:hypothetical protein